MRIDVFHSPEDQRGEDVMRVATEVAHRIGVDADVHSVIVTDDETAARLEIPGLPTIRVDGVDAGGRSAISISCLPRTYVDGSAIPPKWMIEATILRSIQPQHILFLCVANSARSQMAEGIARSLAPRGVAISSAGSRPALVHPAAIQVLSEQGVDISSHKAKSVDDIDALTIDTVVTLCADEVCPAFLEKAHKVHWSIPDPATARGDDDAVVDAFRQARDEIRQRLEHLFRGWVF